MKKIVLIVVGLAVLALPPAAAAVKPTKYERQLARIECLSERGVDAVSRAEFRATYPGKKPLRVCIRIKAAELAAERAIASSEARIACQEEKAADPLGFREEYPGGIKQCIRLESAP
jgi:acid phosphatase class B